MNSFLHFNKYLDHAVLHPTSSKHDLAFNAEIAIKYDTATLCVKSCDVIDAARLLHSSGVKVCSVVGFPHGNTIKEIKLNEVLKAIDSGAQEIDMVVNLGNVLGQNWHSIEEEIGVITSVCKDRKTPLKVIFENAFLSDHHIVNLCQICTKMEVDFVKTSTGFGYVKNSEGSFTPYGAQVKDLILMKQSIGPHVKIKASGGINTYEMAKNFIELGVHRIGTSNTESIMKEYEIQKSRE
ncbi:MAG: deoxyribose-phosphate aldolase [Bacteroidota bacterium]|jgi:deoxyribose-phosphate aldolase